MYVLSTNPAPAMISPACCILHVTCYMCTVCVCGKAQGGGRIQCMCVCLCVQVRTQCVRVHACVCVCEHTYTCAQGMRVWAMSSMVGLHSIHLPAAATSVIHGASQQQHPCGA